MTDSRLTVSHRFQALIQPVRELSPRTEVLMLLLIAAETMIVSIFAGTLLATYAPPHSPLPVLLIFGVLAFARAIPHLLETMRIWSPEYEIVMVVGILATMLVVIKVGAFPDLPLASTVWAGEARDALILRENDAIRPVWLLVAFTGFAWWRGRTRAEATLETGYSMLRFGLIWIAAALLFTVVVAPPESAIYSMIPVVVVAFLIFTLLAIAIARHPDGADQNAESSWVWLLIFAAPILAISAVAISSVELLTRDTLDLLLKILGPVFWLIRVMLQAMVLAVAVVAFILVSPVIWFLDRQGFRPLSNMPNINLSPAGQLDTDSFASTTLQIENPIRYLIAGLILLALIWFLVRFAFRRRKRWNDHDRQQRESLVDWEGSSPSLLQRARGWVAARLWSENRWPWPSSPEWASTRRIRRAYLRFLRVNRSQDVSRQPGETPSQFASRVAQQYGESRGEIAELTSRYNQARYSGTPAGPADADHAERAYEAFLDRLDKDG